MNPNCRNQEQIGSFLPTQHGKIPSCQVIDSILECPGFDPDENYLSINPENTQGINNYIVNPTNKPFTDPEINNLYKKSISNRINKMNYNTASGNINQRRERLGASQEKDMTSNASVIKNQESEGIPVLNEQTQTIITPPPSLPSLPSPLPMTPPLDVQNNSIASLWSQYKFWIIAGIVLILLIFMAIGLYMSSGNTGESKIGELETVTVGVKSPESFKESVENPLTKIVEKPSVETSPVPEFTASPK